MPSSDPAKRVLDIERAIERIRSYTADIGGVEALVSDSYVHRDAVERQLLIVAEAASKLRGQVEALEPGIDWDAVRGIGNVLRHDYDGVDSDILREVLTEDLDPLFHACSRLLLQLEKQ